MCTENVFLVHFVSCGFAFSACIERTRSTRPRATKKRLINAREVHERTHALMSQMSLQCSANGGARARGERECAGRGAEEDEESDEDRTRTRRTRRPISKDSRAWWPGR